MTSLDQLPADIISEILKWLPEYAVFTLAGTSEHMFVTLYALCGGATSLPWVRAAIQNGFLDLFLEMEPQLSRTEIQMAIGNERAHPLVMAHLRPKNYKFKPKQPQVTTIQDAINVGNPILVDRFLMAGASEQKLNLPSATIYIDKWNRRFIYDVLLRCQQYQPCDRFLETACYYQLDTIVARALTDPRIDPTLDNNAVMRLACMKGYTEIVKLLIADPRIDPAAIDNSPIRWACGRNHTQILIILLADPRVDPTAGDNSCIQNACAEGLTVVVNLLLAGSRVNPAANNNYAIRHASLYAHTEVVKLLLAHPQVDPTANNNEAIRSAIKHGHTEVEKILRADPRVGNVVV